VLAFPRGRSTTRVGALRLTSTEGGGRWTLALRAPTARTGVELQASLATLTRPLRPCDVTLDGRSLPRSTWSYDARGGVLRARFAVPRRATLVATGCGANQR
jgi:hypothetical protein